MQRVQRLPTPSPIETITELASEIAGLEVRLLPRHWRKVGDVLILECPEGLFAWREDIAGIYAGVLGAKTVVEQTARIHGSWRVPEVRWLWGNGTETVHREDGVRFKLDVAQVMFSAGNLHERMRIGRIVKPGEVVVDLFAGIGYFSLPVAVHSNPAKVIACEVNPVAFRYLEQNIASNRAAAIEARLGDCREVAPVGVADRVIMGHFEADQYLDVAFRTARSRVTIHLHTLLSAAERGVDSLSTLLHHKAERAGFLLTGLGVRFIKSFRPHVRHAVADATFARGVSERD